MIIKYLRSNKNSIIFILVLAIIGIITGIILFNNLDSSLKSSVIDKIKDLTINISDSNQNNIIYHLCLISILVIFNLIVVGVPLSVFYYFYEFTTIGFLLASFFFYKKVRGLLFSIILLISYKGLFLVILSYFIISAIKYLRNLFLLRKVSKKSLLLNQLYKGIFVIILLLLIDLIIYFVGNKILSIFLFLI